MFVSVDAINRAAAECGVKEGIPQFQRLASHDQYRACYRAIDRWLAADPTGLRCLDWGCGNGHLSFYLHNIACDVSGYSYDDAPAGMRGVAGFSFTRGLADDPVRLPYDDASFDAVFSMGVLEHVHEFGGSDEGSLAELHRVLRPGGHFLCFHLPNAGTWIEAVAKRVTPSAHIHSRTYTRSMVIGMWARHGFEVLEAKRYGFLPRNLLRRLSPTVDLSPVRAAINAFDDLGAAIAAPICQNWSIIARKPA